MSALPELPRETFIELDRTLRRFGAANRVSLIVGYILGPLLFGGIGGALWLVIPEPFGTYVGGSIIGAGALFMLFLLWYARRSNAPAFAALAVVHGATTIEGRYGDRASSLKAAILEARALDHAGYGEPIAGLAGTQPSLRLTSEKLTEVVPPGQQAVLLCMPTNEVVAIWYAGQLTLA